MDPGPVANVKASDFLFFLLIDISEEHQHRRKLQFIYKFFCNYEMFGLVRVEFQISHVPLLYEIFHP